MSPEDAKEMERIARMEDLKDLMREPAPRLGPNHKDGETATDAGAWERIDVDMAPEARLLALVEERLAEMTEAERERAVNAVLAIQPAPLPEQAPVSPGMGKGESKAQGRAHLCITFKQGSARCDVCGDRLAVNVPRETLERVVGLVESVAERVGSLDWTGAGCCPFCETLPLGRPEPPCTLQAVLAELRGLVEGE